VLVSQLGGRLRACTHLDVTAGMIEEALTLIRRELSRG
jgi:threonine aldolase